MSEKVIIGVPIYKGEKYLEETLHSILRQTYRNYEVVLSIDGPDPVCENLCQPFLKDPRLRIVIQPKRLGWVGNFNWLLTQASGDFWYYHQQDDLTEPEYIEALLDHARHHPEAANVSCDLLPMGRIETPFRQMPSVVGATPFVRMITMLHEHYPAFAFRGLTRTAAIRTAGPAPENDVENFGVDICWLTGVARHGELHRVPRGLYRKRYHQSNTESKWWEWGKQERSKPWVTHCVDMLEQALRIDASVPERRLLWLAAVDRLTSVSAASYFLQAKELTSAERLWFYEWFYKRATTISKTKDRVPQLLDSTWPEIYEWTRGYLWQPKGEPYKIEAVGPQPVIAGVPFNRQRDGESAIWVRLSRPSEPGMKLKLGETILETRAGGLVITAIVPASATAAPGIKSLMVVGHGNEARSEPVMFEVKPA